MWVVCRLQQVPSEMTSLRALEHLSLSHNQLQSLEGSCIAPLIMLQRLELQHNQLTSVPSECGSLTSLQELNAAHNQLQSLPTTLGQLTCLRSLLLDHNRYWTRRSLWLMRHAALPISMHVICLFRPAVSSASTACTAPFSGQFG